MTLWYNLLPALVLGGASSVAHYDSDSVCIIRGLVHSTSVVYYIVY